MGTSFGLACMVASTAFFFLRLPSFSERYKPALCYTGLVTFIAFYHYMRIFNSFDAAFAPCAVEDGVMNFSKCDPEMGYSSTGHSFNDAYRCKSPSPPAGQGADPCCRRHGLAPDRAPAAD